MSATGSREQLVTAPANRIILLGASNLTLSRKLVIGLMQERLGAPSDVLVAAGHGRSYGHDSQVLIRGLPGITDCGLWPHLESAQQLPTYALMTDIGNDIPYGHTPEQLLEWTGTCIDRLQRAQAQILVTNMQLDLIENLSERHFRIIRSLFFPFSRLTRSEVIERSRLVHRGLQIRAAQSGVDLVELEPHWFGPDIIHVLYWKRKAFYRQLLERFSPLQGSTAETFGGKPSRLAWVQRPRFARKYVLGHEWTHRQPSGLLNNHSRVSSY